MGQVVLTTLPGIPLVKPGDDLVAIVLDGVAAAGLALENGDIVAVAQKIVSKAEGRIVRFADVTPSAAAHAWAVETGKDPRLAELVLQESTEVLRAHQGVMIVRHKLGHVGANAGIDQSNVGPDHNDVALLLPVDPDASAARLRDGLRERTGKNVGVIINDSVGRAWRIGNLGLAIGSAGIMALEDRRGDVDMFGRELKITLIPRADNIAAAAALLMGEVAEASPVVLVRGLPEENSEQTSAVLVRPKDKDLFR